MRWLDGITDSMHMDLSKFWEMMKNSFFWQPYTLVTDSELIMNSKLQSLFFMYCFKAILFIMHSSCYIFSQPKSKTVLSYQLNFIFSESVVTGTCHNSYHDSITYSTLFSIISIVLSPSDYIFYFWSGSLLCGLFSTMASRQSSLVGGVWVSHFSGSGEYGLQQQQQGF